MFKQGLLLVSILAVTGCTTRADINLREARFDTGVKISEYNSVASRYLEKATFAKAIRADTIKGDTVKYAAKSYESFYSEGSGYINVKLEIVVHESDVVHVEKAINKYLEWEQKASEKGDTVDKVILKHDSGFNSAKGYEYGFYSGNSSTHYLTIANCGVFGSCGKPQVFLGKNSVLALQRDLKMLADGTLVNFSASDEYQ